MVYENSFTADRALDCDREVGIMRVIALILVLVTSVIGFIMSYGFAYKKVTGVLYSSTATMQSSASVSTDR